jgi:hypothetical protein
MQNFGYRPILDCVKSYLKLVKWFERRRAPKPRVKSRIHLEEVQPRWGKTCYSMNAGLAPWRSSICS